MDTAPARCDASCGTHGWQDPHPNAVSIPGQRRRRWPCIGTALGQCVLPGDRSILLGRSESCRWMTVDSGMCWPVPMASRPQTPGSRATNWPNAGRRWPTHGPALGRFLRDHSPWREMKPAILSTWVQYCMIPLAPLSPAANPCSLLPWPLDPVKYTQSNAPRRTTQCNICVHFRAHVLIDISIKS